MWKYVEVAKGKKRKEAVVEGARASDEGGRGEATGDRV